MYDYGSVLFHFQYIFHECNKLRNVQWYSVVGPGCVLEVVNQTTLLIKYYLKLPMDVVRSRFSSNTLNEEVSKPETRVIFWPIFFTLNAPVFFDFGQHYYDFDILLPDHVPKIVHGGRQRGLSGNEGFWDVVTLDNFNQIEVSSKRYLR